MISRNEVYAFSRDEHGVHTYPLHYERGRIVGREAGAVATHLAASQPAQGRNRFNSSVREVTSGVVASLRQLRTAFDPKQYSFIPVVGEIAAGNYQVTIAYRDYGSTGNQSDDMVALSGSVAEGSYALRVRGTSMTHVGINPGDVVVIKPQSWAEDGDFVVAELTDSDDPAGYITLKQFYRKRDHVYLKSATAAKEPIRLYPQRGEDSVLVQGRVVAVIKPQN